MAPCGLHKKRTVLLFTVAVLSLLIACNSADEEAGPRGALSETATGGSTSTPAATPTPTPTPVVEVAVSKTIYRVGQRVRYSISNHGDRPVYYRGRGCTWPFIVMLEGGNEVQLAINITDIEIPTSRLAAGETLSCEWNQRAWSGEGREWGNHRVPPGRYQFRFRYAFEEDHVYSQVVSTVIKSPVFTIE